MIILLSTVVGVGQDVTEDRRKEHELRKMQCVQATHEAKVETERNMTAYFAHELRNPLNAIDNVSPDRMAFPDRPFGSPSHSTRLFFAFYFSGPHYLTR